MLKVDDDVFVAVPDLIAILRGSSVPDNFILGKIQHRAKSDNTTIK